MEVKRELGLERKPLNSEYLTTSNYLKFIIFSLLGIILYLVPVTYNGKITIGVGIFAEYFQGLLEGYLPGFMTVIFCFSTIMAIYMKLFKPSWIERHTFFRVCSI